MKKIPFFGEVGLDIKVNEMEAQLRGKDDVVLLMDSPGGDVFAGMSIYNMLKSYEGKVIVDILGMAGSISSIIALAADRVRMSETATFFMHNALVPATGGNASQLRDTADVLEQVSNTIRRVYTAKSKLPDTRVSELMNKESVLNADQAFKLGLVDEIINPVAIAAKYNKIDMNKLQELKNLTASIGKRLGIKGQEEAEEVPAELDAAITEEVEVAVAAAEEIATELETLSEMVGREEFEQYKAEIAALLEPLINIVQETSSTEEVEEIVEAKTTTKIAAVLKAMKAKTTIPSAANNFAEPEVLNNNDRLPMGFLDKKQKELKLKNGN